MRTITVVFTNRMLSVKEMLSHKRYKFLCNYDTISLYDMVEDPRYTSKMLVTGFTNCTNRVQDGITLKDIYITKVNGQAINQPAGDELKLNLKYISNKVYNTCFCIIVPA